MPNGSFFYLLFWCWNVKSAGTVVLSKTIVNCFTYSLQAAIATIINSFCICGGYFHLLNP